MGYLKFCFFLLLGFVVGSLNPSIFITKLKLNEDIRKYGDGNPGATNVFQNVGKLYGILSGLFDILKNFSVLSLAYHFGIRGLYLSLLGASVMLGHDFTIFYGFRGGAGIATFFGGLLFFSPKLAFSILIISFMVVILLYRLLKKRLPFGFQFMSLVEAIGIGVFITIAAFYGGTELKIYVFASLIIIVLRKFNAVKSLLKEAHI
jgi:glycerol-3-phosphate acyltransferase PlsY